MVDSGSDCGLVLRDVTLLLCYVLNEGLLLGIIGLLMFEFGFWIDCWFGLVLI